jgi:hypothetical protein
MVLRNVDYCNNTTKLCVRMDQAMLIFERVEGKCGEGSLGEV